jgi:hypothetical protein
MSAVIIQFHASRPKAPGSGRKLHYRVGAIANEISEMRVNIEDAARRVQVSPAQLHERHARLMRDAERVMASIAWKVTRRLSPVTPAEPSA